MDFGNVKSLIIPEGAVKELKIGGLSVWRKGGAKYRVQITTDNTNAITGLKYLQSASITFTADYSVPADQQSISPTWTVSGLPSGMSAQSLSGESLTVSGYPESSGNFTVTVGVTKGGYSDSKTYTLTVENVSYGVSITTSNASAIKDFYVLRDASKTFTATFNVPPQQQDDTVTWSFSGLPSGLSASGATVSGYASGAGTSTVTVTVTKGSYSDSKKYTFEVSSDGYGIEKPSLYFPDYENLIDISANTMKYTVPPYIFRGDKWTGSCTATANVPSSAGALKYFYSISTNGYQNWISLDSATGEIVLAPDNSTFSKAADLYIYMPNVIRTAAVQQLIILTLKTQCQIVLISTAVYMEIM